MITTGSGEPLVFVTHLYDVQQTETRLPLNNLFYHNLLLQGGAARDDGGTEHRYASNYEENLDPFSKFGKRVSYNYFQTAFIVKKKYS